MRFPLIILFFLSVGCTSSINEDEVELRANGLSYINGTDQLVKGKVVRNFENGDISEFHSYINGRPIGKWAAYGINGEVTSHGEGVDAKKFERSINDISLGNSFISISQTKDFSYITFYLDNREIFKDPRLLIALSKAILEEYSVKYGFDRLFVYDNEHEYTVEKSAFDYEYLVDTLKDRSLKTMFIR